MKIFSKRLVLLTMIILMITLCFTGCKKNIFGKNSAPLTSDTSQSTGSSKNMLTGLDISQEYKNARPIGVMINNIKKAQPLLGVSQADVMYECLVEGGITRILAVFENPYDIEKIGSVRSARPYFIRIAQGLDAVYLHIGGSAEALNILESTPSIDSFNLGSYSDMMWRDPARQKNLGQEHSALTSGEKIKNGLKKAGIRTTLKSDYKFRQSFSDNSPVLEGQPAQKLTAEFSSYKSTSFAYDSAKKTYLISQFGSAQMDATSNIQNSKPNVLVLRINTYTIDSGGHQGMDLIGNGEGYYMCQGKMINIKWSKASNNDPIKYTTADGKDLVMIPGQIYVCVVPLNTSVEAE